MDNIFKYVRIKPWVGSKYFKSEKRILILGESLWYRHRGVKLENQAVHYISEIINGWEVRFYENIHFSIGYNYFTNDIFKANIFWNNVVFYEYVQFQIHKKSRPSGNQWLASENAFYEVIEKYKPKVVICCGYQLYNRLLLKNGQKCKSIIIDANEVQVYKYNIKSYFTFFLKIKHPSRGYDKEFWRKAYRSFEKKYMN